MQSPDALPNEVLNLGLHFHLLNGPDLALSMATSEGGQLLVNHLTPQLPMQPAATKQNDTYGEANSHIGVSGGAAAVSDMCYR